MQLCPRDGARLVPWSPVQGQGCDLPSPHPDRLLLLPLGRFKGVFLCIHENLLLIFSSQLQNIFSIFKAILNSVHFSGILFIPGSPSKGYIKLDREIISFLINNREFCGPAALQHRGAPIQGLCCRATFLPPHQS